MKLNTLASEHVAITIVALINVGLLTRLFSMPGCFGGHVAASCNTRVRIMSVTERIEFVEHLPTLFFNFSAGILCFLSSVAGLIYVLSYIVRCFNIYRLQSSIGSFMNDQPTNLFQCMCHSLFVS